MVPAAAHIRGTLSVGHYCHPRPSTLLLTVSSLALSRCCPNLLTTLTCFSSLYLSRSFFATLSLISASPAFTDLIRHTNRSFSLCMKSSLPEAALEIQSFAECMRVHWERLDGWIDSDNGTCARTHAHAAARETSDVCSQGRSIPVSEYLSSATPVSVLGQLILCALAISTCCMIQ